MLTSIILETTFKVIIRFFSNWVALTHKSMSVESGHESLCYGPIIFPHKDTRKRKIGQAKSPYALKDQQWFT